VRRKPSKKEKAVSRKTAFLLIESVFPGGAEVTFPQGLKPALIFAAFAARSKTQVNCFVINTDISCVFMHFGVHNAHGDTTKVVPFQTCSAPMSELLWM
jgi:hypothetical protein